MPYGSLVKYLAEPEHKVILRKQVAFVSPGRLAKNRSCANQLVCQTMQLAEAIAFLHVRSEPIYHGDLKAVRTVAECVSSVR